MFANLDHHDAVLALNVQNDLCPGGALPAPRGDEVVGVLNEWIAEAQHAGVAIVVSRIWHPADHSSFRRRGGTWPPHCIGGGWGAQFHPGLRFPQHALVISKATTRDWVSHSDFVGTELTQHLHQAGVRRLWIGGLATEYGVLATALDGVKEGFEVHLIEEAIRALELRPGDGERALEQMHQAGVLIGAEAAAER